MMFIIEFFRVRGIDEAHAILDRVEHDATDLEDVKVRALSLFATSSSRRKCGFCSIELDPWTEA
jgi:hypothetical protein